MSGPDHTARARELCERLGIDPDDIGQDIASALRAAAAEERAAVVAWMNEQSPYVQDVRVWAQSFAKRIEMGAHLRARGSGR